MRLLATIVATAAVIALASAQSPQVVAQGADTQTGVSTSQSGAGVQRRGSGKVSARESATSKQSISGRAEDRERSGVRPETNKTSANSETTIRGRSQTHVAVSSGRHEDEDIVLKRKRAHREVTEPKVPVRVQSELIKLAKKMGLKYFDGV